MVGCKISLVALLVRLAATAAALSASSVPLKVSVIGTTGHLGREAIQQLSKRGIATKCLLRHALVKDDGTSTAVPTSLDQAETSAQVAAYLNTLPGVEMVPGDVTDPASLTRLVANTTVCLALYGPSVPKPFFRALFPFWYPSSLPQHPKQVNFQGVVNLLTVLQDESSTCRRLVRITGKGENPWSIFSILINAFGGIAKGWNYEAEQLLRNQSTVDYTIIRPGIMKDTLDITTTTTLGLLDNGRDLKVSAVSYEQIAELAIDSAFAENCRRTTLTAMNVDSSIIGTEKLPEIQTLDQVASDTRDFPSSLLLEHRKAARVGGLGVLAVTLLLAKIVAALVANIVTSVLK